MTKTEGITGRPEHPTDQDNISFLDHEGVKDLVSTNLQALVISPANLILRFGEKGERFLPKLFQPIQIVRVRTADGDIIELIRDGHHRAEYVADDENNEAIIRAFPNFLTPKQDVTDDVLTMLDKIPNEEETSALTITEYWEDVLPYTHQHAESESKRTTSNLVTGWPHRVGQTLAEKYSAFAVLCVLTDTTLIGKSKEEIQAYLYEYFSQEPEKGKLVAGMLDMKDIFTKANLDRSEARREASLFVYTEPKYIGGKDEGERQIAGLLELPPVQAKLLPFDPTIKRLLIMAFKQADKKIGYLIDDIFDSLTDPLYSREHLIEILRAKNPSRKKEAINKELTLEQRKNEYKTRVGRDLTDIEQLLLNKNLTERLIGEVNEQITIANRRMQNLPEGSPHQMRIQRCIYEIKEASSRQVRAALDKLIVANADSGNDNPLHTYAAPGQNEVLFLRSAATNLQTKLRAMTTQRDEALTANIALKKRVETLEHLLNTAGVIYPQDSSTDD